MLGQPDPDAALMLLVKQGDSEAFATLVDKYKGPVINLAWRMLQDPTEAEDMAQNVFLQVYRSADRYRIASKFSTWLFTIARNLCLNELRRRSRHRAQSLEGCTQPDGDRAPLQIEDPKLIGPPESLLHRELSIKIEEALQALPENQRTAVLLCRQDDLSYDDIAEVMGGVSFGG